MEVKVTNGIEKLKKCQGKSNQARLDCFFKAGAAKSSTSGPTTKGKAAAPMMGKKSMPAGKK